MRAVWNGAILAESKETIVVESNRYSPPESLNRGRFIASDAHPVWKGTAIVVDGS